MDNPQQILVDNYSKAPALLEYKLFQVFGLHNTPEKVAVYNDIMQDILLMTGGSLESLCVEVARLIIETGKMDMRKDRPLEWFSQPITKNI
jgi:hypothetical protein